MLNLFVYGTPTFCNPCDFRLGKVARGIRLHKVLEDELSVIINLIEDLIATVAAMPHIYNYRLVYVYV